MYAASLAATDLEVAIDCVVGTLRVEVDRDWTAPAGLLEWSCRRTLSTWDRYSPITPQVAIKARTRSVRWAARAQQPDTPPDGVLDLFEATGRILALVVRASSDEARAVHPYGIADPAGFAAGGCVEGLIHGHDIAAGLGVALEPPKTLCEHLLARLFPHHAAQFVDVDPRLALRQETGRADLTDGARVKGWKWRATPLSEQWRLTEPEPAAFVYKNRTALTLANVILSAAALMDRHKEPGNRTRNQGEGSAADAVATPACTGPHRPPS